MDPLTLIAGAKTSLDTATQIVKTYIAAKEAISEIEQKTKSLELMENIVNAKSNIVELKSALIDKDEKIQRLEKELKLKKEMIFEAPVYWHIENNVKDGPFCQKCYDVDKNLVRLQVFDVSHEGAWNCSACGGHYRTKEYSEWANEQLA